MAASLLWRRLDVPGHELVRLERNEDGGWELGGTAVFLHELGPCRLDYAVACDAAWRTRSARVAGLVGERAVELALAVDADGRWSLNGERRTSVDGCVDVDLGFSPSTNLLPIRRLALAVGAEARVRAAWLGFPSLDLEPLDQLYRREGERTYRYESTGGAFVRTLAVDGTGFVVDYPGLWRVERPAHERDQRAPSG